MGLLDRFVDWLLDHLGKVLVALLVLFVGAYIALAWMNHKVKTKCPVEPICEQRETTYYYKVGSVMMPFPSQTETCRCPAWEAE